MGCEKYENMIPDYISDELPQAEKEILDEHLEICAACRAVLADYKKTGQQIAVLSRMEQIADLKPGIMSRISGERSKKSLFNWLKPAVSMLSIAVVLALLLTILPIGGNGETKTLLAKVQEATEQIESYSVEGYHIDNGRLGIDEPETTSTYTFDYMSPDLAYLKFSFISEVWTKAGFSNKYDGYEAYFIGDYQYYSFTGDGCTRWNITSEYNFLARGIPDTQEIAFTWLAHLNEMEQLDDEVISGVLCMHYTGISKSYDTIIEIWIGKDDYLIRQISQTGPVTQFVNGVGEETDEYGTSVERYYNFNEDISIELPLDDSGNLPDGWTHDLLVKEEPRDPGVPLDEALAGITGDEDWSDPSVVESVYEMYISCADGMGFFNALPEEGQLALHDYLNSFIFTTSEVTCWRTHYAYGVFHFEGNGIKAEVNLITVVGSDVWVEDPDSIVYFWKVTLMSDDPQAYFDSLPYETRQKMESAFSIRGFFGQLIFMIQQATEI
jgi:hypothetical protein